MHPVSQKSSMGEEEYHCLPCSLRKLRHRKTGWSPKVTKHLLLGRWARGIGPEHPCSQQGLHLYSDSCFFILSWTTSDICIMFSLIFLNCFEHTHSEGDEFLCLPCLVFILKNQLLPLNFSLVLRLPMGCDCRWVLAMPPCMWQNNKQWNGQGHWGGGVLQKKNTRYLWIWWHVWISATVLFNLIHRWKGNFW